MTPAHVATLALKAERARTLADIHNALCRYRRQGLRCSTCQELNDRAARLARAAGEQVAVRAVGCQACGEPHGVSVPCGYRRAAS